jgi:hypothetical protein
MIYREYKYWLDINLFLHKICVIETAIIQFSCEDL